ncbi:MAG: ATP phosphoribosyltransferase [bacterium]|nr:ATP phosphoribosyltransferase [bacterium]
MLKIALTKGKLFDCALDLFEKAGIIVFKEVKNTRKLSFLDKDKNIEFSIIRAFDVPTYVEYGACDIGIAGKDILLEQNKDLYEPLDLKFGHCKLVVAEPVDIARNDNIYSWSQVRIATKYPHITEKYFSEKGIQVEVIKLYGSVELAPLMGLSERIVDLVETGKTLQENGLVVIEEMLDVTARLVVNRASFKTKDKEISKFLNIIKAAL